ncbi:hypothetical protein HanOQP8_Chr04g0136961 [Helianthus annuus]|nr:hypothetical protein HanLR1_Chr04g0128921 [Helianthus annuus]KAJ0760351.1 hypothetical protein HanOQP8_Chr04g0136961 [Helianthus annuus]KAJ0930145.1 hypothetical protein HanPSC8_Chr04g0145891 [Helianthus annuus]
MIVILLYIFLISSYFSSVFSQIIRNPNPYHQPKKPQFKLQQVVVEYIIIAAPVATVASLSLSVQLLFTTKNDNTVGIKYATSTFNIMYRGFLLGRDFVPGFFPTCTQCTTGSDNCDRISNQFDVN